MHGAALDGPGASKYGTFPSKRAPLGGPLEINLAKGPTIAVVNSLAQG